MRKLRRQNSTKSLITEFGLHQSEMSRRDSVLSLKSLGKELLTNIKSKNPFENDENYLGRWLLLNLWIYLSFCTTFLQIRRKDMYHEQTKKFHEFRIYKHRN